MELKIAFATERARNQQDVFSTHSLSGVGENLTLNKATRLAMRLAFLTASLRAACASNNVDGPLDFCDICVIPVMIHEVGTKYVFAAC